MSFYFIDLCAGIGGFRFALESFEGKCTLSSEIDSNTNHIYSKIHQEDNVHGDLFNIDISQIKDFDVLCAGFPCQPFSSSGKQEGFKDPRGNVFFGILKIIQAKKPNVIFLENVKNLLIHNNGHTLQTIVSLLCSEGYDVSYSILNSKDFDSPQNRERLYIIASKSKKFSFERLLNQKQDPNLEEFLVGARNYINFDYTLISDTERKKQKSGLIFSGYLNKNLRKTPNKNVNISLSRYHKQPNRIYHTNGTHPTLSAQESSGRYYLYDGVGVFKISDVDLVRLQGFDIEILAHIKNASQLNKVIGNAVNPNVISCIFKEVLRQELLL